MKKQIDIVHKMHTLEYFKFDKPSPDDVVMQAQKQSRAFQKLNIASWLLISTPIPIHNDNWMMNSYILDTK